MDNMEQVAHLTRIYDIFHELDKMSAYMDNLTIENACESYQLAVEAGNQQLLHFSEMLICQFDVFTSDGFHRLGRHYLKTILQMDTLLRDEVYVFEACIAWAKFACTQNGMDSTNMSNLKTHLAECFHFIRFATIPMETFVRHTEPYKKIFTAEEFASIVNPGRNIFNPVKRSKVLSWRLL